MDERPGAAEVASQQAPAAFIEEAFDAFDRELESAGSVGRGKRIALAVAYASETPTGIPERWLIELFDTTVEWSFLGGIESLFRTAAHYGLVLVQVDQWIENLHGEEDQHAVVVVERGERDALAFLRRNVVRPCCEMLFRYDLLKSGFVGTVEWPEEAAG
jgi:hypothetical protein